MPKHISDYKASSNDINTGTEDAKFLTPAQFASSKFMRFLSTTGGLGDISADGLLIVAVADSHTEQFNQNQGASDQISILRSTGGPWENLVGFLNGGGSGQRLYDFINGALGSLPSVPTTGNLGVNNWDYYGHKPTGAFSLNTLLAWRVGKADKVAWLINGGTNDLILYSATGNLSQAAITTYIADLLSQAIDKIQIANPQDYIILSIPNPMVARPYSAGLGFPSASAYPSFGADLTADAALMDKWNYGLRNAYLQVQNKYPKTKLLDSWDLVFGKPSASLTAGTQVPFLNNLVHATGTADQELIKALAKIISSKPILNINEGRKKEAEARATATSVNAWDIYPGYFKNNPDYKLAGRFGFIGAGSNYLDLSGVYSDFVKRVGGQPFYIGIEDNAAGYFASYSGSATSASSMRFTGVSPSSAIQSASANMQAEIYISNNFHLVSNDSYVNSLASIAKEYYEITIGAGGVGYIDIGINQNLNRFSTKFLSGLSGGTLAVGGTINATIALSTATFMSRSGATSGRTMRIGLSGDQTAKIGQPAAIYFTDDKPSPKSFEYIQKPNTAIVHAQNNKGYLYSDLAMLDGGTFTAAILGGSVGSIVTVDIYSLTFSARTLLGTISIPSGGAAAALSSGNPTSVVAGQVYDAVITSATSSTNGVVLVTLTPN